MKLLITQSDIDHSQPKSGVRCAIATAITRVTGGMIAAVGLDDVWISGINVRGELDLAGERLVSMFDSNKETCRPVVVEITFPESCTEPTLLCDYVTLPDIGDLVPMMEIRSRYQTPVYAN